MSDTTASQPLKWDLLEKDKGHVTLGWLKEHWSSEKGLTLSVKGIDIGNNGRFKWSNVAVGIGLYGVGNMMAWSQGLKVPLLIHLFYLPFAMSIKPAMIGSPRAWRHARSQGANRLKAFESVLHRIGLQIKSLATPNLMETAQMSMTLATLSVDYTAAGFKKIGAQAVSNKLKTIENQWTAKALGFEKKAKAFEQWKAGQLIKVSELEGVDPGQALELYSDWMKVALKHRWARAEMLLNAIMVKKEQDLVGETERKMKAEFEKINRSTFFKTPEAFEAAKDAWAMQSAELYRDQFASLADRLRDANIKEARALGMSAQELDLKEDMALFLSRVKQEPLEYSLLFKRTKASGVKSHFKPADHMPSLLEVIELAFRYDPAMTVFIDAIGELRSLGESHILEGIIGTAVYEEPLRNRCHKPRL